MEVIWKKRGEEVTPADVLDKHIFVSQLSLHRRMAPGEYLRRFVTEHDRMLLQQLHSTDVENIDPRRVLADWKESTTSVHSFRSPTLSSRLCHDGFIAHGNSRDSREFFAHRAERESSN